MTRRSAASPIRSFSARSSSSLPIRRCATRRTISPARKIASGFGFWNQTAGFDISQTLIEYSAQAGTYGRAFWVGLLEHAAGRGDRHRACDHRGLPRRHRAAVEEFPAREALRRIRRADPQSAAPAAAPVLVQRRAQGAAGTARQLDASGQHLPQQSRLLRARADLPAGHAVRRRRADRRDHRRVRVRLVGAQAAGAHRRAGTGRASSRSV